MNSFEDQNISRSTAFEIKNKFSAPTKRSDFLKVQIEPNHLDESDFFALHESLGEGLAILENGRIVFCTKLKVSFYTSRRVFCALSLITMW